MKKGNKKGTRKGCFYLIIILFLVIFGGLYFAINYYNDAVYSPASDDTSTVEVFVEEGDTLLTVADQLSEKGLLKSKLALQIYIRQFNLDPRIKVGRYEVRKNITLNELIQILEEGVFAPGIRVTIKEGLRVELVSSQLAKDLKATKFNKKEFDNIVNNPDKVTFESSELNTFLKAHKPSGKTLEGFIYPDTYEFASDFSSKQIVEVMLVNFMNKIKAEINLESLNLKQSNIKNLFDALTLASIIEREASINDDRAEIASVFHNRLAINMALQSDATVNYVTGKNDPGVLIVDTKIDNPYNTYFYPGLPPGPINSPRIESIKAALYPKKTDYYFFFHDAAGNTYFAVTLDEHNQNIFLHGQ